MIVYEINEHNMPIDEKGEQVKLTSFPHFNGVNWFEFETEEERTNFIQQSI